jgi:hypothetical protein
LSPNSCASIDYEYYVLLLEPAEEQHEETNPVVFKFVCGIALCVAERETVALSSLPFSNPISIMSRYNDEDVADLVGYIQEVRYFVDLLHAPLVLSN